MNRHSIVSREEWLNARISLLAKEKEITDLRDVVTAERHRLPWVRVDKTYVFDGPSGQVTLSALFDGRSRLPLDPGFVPTRETQIIEKGRSLGANCDEADK